MDELKQFFDKVKSINPEALKREGRDFDFVPIYPIIENTFKQLLALESSTKFWDVLPEEKQKDITRAISGFFGVIDRIVAFSPQIANPQGERDNLMKELKNQYKELFEKLLLPLNAFQSGHISLSQELEKELENVADKINKRYEDLETRSVEALKKVEAQQKQSEELLKAMQEAAAKGSVGTFAGIFSEQANSHQISSRIWLWVSMGAAVAMFSFLYFIFQDLRLTLSTGTELSLALQILFSKLILISFASVVFAKLIKNYNAHMHLFILNKHRENSLKTFQSFVQATDDQKVKDAILLQATNTIFSSGDTGFISQSQKEPTTGIEITKVIEQINSKH